MILRVHSYQQTKFFLLTIMSIKMSEDIYEIRVAVMNTVVVDVIKNGVGKKLVVVEI